MMGQNSLCRRLSRKAGAGFPVGDEASFAAERLQIDGPVTGERRLAAEAEKKTGFKQAKSLPQGESQGEQKEGPSKFFLPEDENTRFLDTEISNRIGTVTRRLAGLFVWKTRRG